MFPFPRFLSVLVGLPIARCALNVLQRSSSANTGGALNSIGEWEESVLAAWAQEPACEASVLRGQCGVGAVVVRVQPSGDITSQVYTAGAGGGLAPFDGQKMTSIFPIASNTKILTSILLVSLADHGKLAMDETVGSFLDQTCGSLPQPVANITLFQLASQTSGLPAQPTNRHLEPCKRDPVDCNPFTQYTVQDLCQTLREVTLGPKGHYLYSNLAFGMLGYLLERRMGSSFEHLTHTWVLQPLGMYSGKITLNETEWQTLTPQGKDARTGEGRWRRQPYGILQGNGAFLVSIPDMGRLVGSMIKAERGRETPLAASLRQTLQPVTWSGLCACNACEEEELLKLSIPTAERGVVAMGWESSSSGLRRGWHKAGDIAGYSSWMAFNAASGRGAFGVDTCGGCGAELGSLRGSAVQQMVQLLADGPPEVVAPLPQLAEAELSALVGDFKACPAAPGKTQSSSLSRLSLSLHGSDRRKLLASTESFSGERSPAVTASPYSSAESDGLQAFSGVVLALSDPVGTIHGGANAKGPLATVAQRRSIHFLADSRFPNKRGAAVLHIGGVDVFFVDDVSQCP